MHKKPQYQLTTKIVHALLHIKLSGSSRNEFDLKTAVDKWGKLKNRRVLVGGIMHNKLTSRTREMPKSNHSQCGAS